MAGDYGVEKVYGRDADTLWKQFRGHLSGDGYRGDILAYQALGLLSGSDDCIEVADYRWDDISMGNGTYLRFEDEEQTTAARFLEDEVLNRMDDPDEATYGLRIKGKQKAAYRLRVTLPEDATWRDKDVHDHSPDFVIKSTIPLEDGASVEDLLDRYNIPIRDGQSK